MIANVKRKTDNKKLDNLIYIKNENKIQILSKYPFKGD